MPKKYFLITALLIGAFIGVHVASAAVSFAGFTFDQTVTTSKGKQYFVDLIAGESEELNSGKYNLVTKLGFYGVTDPENDWWFENEIFNLTDVKFKKAGANSYIGESMYVSTTWSNVPGEPGRMVYDTGHSTAGGNSVEPGDYTVDAILDGKVISTYEVCLPSFTSKNNIRLGNVTCGATPPANPPATSTATTTTTSTTTTSALINPTFELVSLLAPATTVTIKGTVTSGGTTSVTSPVDLLIWPNGGAGVPQKVASTDSLVIDSNGVSFTISHPGLVANSSYNYRFIVSTTNEVVYENTFLTSTSFDQAVVLVNGACGNATESPQASQPTAEGALCGAGKPGAVSGTGPWTWTCMGEGGGTDAPCEAESLSSAGGATCGSAQGTERDESKPPAAEGELCSKGVAGTVTATATGWSWKCTVDNASATCSATKKTASGAEGGDEITTKSLLQNPFKTLDSFPKIIKAVVNNIVLPIAVPFIAVMLIYSGFLFVVARRNGDVYNIQKAKQTLVYTLIGATLTLGAFVIANAIQGTLNSIVSTRYQSQYETRV